MDEHPYKIGQLLIDSYSEAMTVKNRVYQVVTVHKLGREPFAYYRYDVRNALGEISEGSAGMETFYSYREKLHLKLATMYKTVNNQEKKIIAIDKLEKEAKKYFKTPKEEHSVAP